MGAKPNLLEFLAAANVQHSTDPVVFAAESAFAAVAKPGLNPEHTAQRAMSRMPASSTKFERGIAFGIALALAISVSGCGAPPRDTSRSVASDNPSMHVTRLFEVDGCRVYKFHDGGYDRYFANCPGSTQWTRSAGKTTRSESVETAVR